MDPLPPTEVRIVSASPGRVRIALNGLHGSPARQHALEQRFSAHPGVIGAWASALTGRVLLLFSARTSLPDLLRELGLVVAPAAVPAGREAAVRPGAGAQPHPVLYPPWHLHPADAALAHHASSAQRGLAAAEARRRLRQGSNRIAPPPRRSRTAILLDQFSGTPVLLLAVSALGSLLTGALAEAAAVGAVLAVNAAIGYRTESQAEGDMASLAELVDQHVAALRGGRVVRVPSADVVPGDVLVLAPGTRIAADLRLLAADGLRIDESPLTGESRPVRKDTAALAHDAPLAERCNMAYRGTAVCAGSGRGLVVGTGSRTEAGAIDLLTRSVQRPTTPIQAQLDQLGRQLVAVSSVMCLAVVAVGLLRGQRAAPLLRSGIALAVAAVPEGLPTVATTALSRGLRRMRERQVLFRHLRAVEAIGTISTICLDKTGTLTANRMSAVALRTCARAYEADDLDSLRDLQAAAPLDPALARLLQVCVLCSESWSAQASGAGSSTENALLDLARRAGLAPAALRADHPLLASTLRTEGRNYMRTTHALPGSPRRLVAVKGSPPEVLALCAEVLEDGRPRPLDPDARARALRQNQEMAGRGLRVLAFASAEIGPDQAPEGAPLTWLGLAGMADPLRPGAAAAVERFHAAGIRTTMLTGDQAATAAEIGRSLKLNGDGALNIVDSRELAQASAAHLRTLAEAAHVFSRVTPSEKLSIVKALQASGARVAMTGDGINDSPALRAADVGIAMGSGTDIALSVADMALKHDRLDTLLDAIAQGRTISDNIRKSVHFLVSSNLSEILIVFGGVALGGGSPLGPLQLLWTNLLTDVLPAIGLAEEAAEADVMQRPPRDPQSPLVSRSDLLAYAREAGALATGALGAYAYGVARHGKGARAATIAFDALMLGQMLHTLLCRSEHGTFFDRRLPPNKQLAWSLAATAGLQGLAHLVPGLRRLLGLSTLGWADLLAVAAGAGLPLLANDLMRSRDGGAHRQ